MQNLWLIPALPFLGFLANGIFGRKFPKAVINAIAILSVLASFAKVLVVFLLRRPNHNSDLAPRRMFGIMRGKLGQWAAPHLLELLGEFARDRCVAGTEHFGHVRQSLGQTMWGLVPDQGCRQPRSFSSANATKTRAAGCLARRREALHQERQRRQSG